jgi:hypothetical protein
MSPHRPASFLPLLASFLAPIVDLRLKWNGSWLLGARTVLRAFGTFQSCKHAQLSNVRITLCCTDGASVGSSPFEKSALSAMRSGSCPSLEARSAPPG